MEHSTFGRHVIAEFHGVAFDTLDNGLLVTEAMINGAEKAGATVLHHYMHEFEPQGFSSVVVLAESHVTVHTFPEHGYAAFDAYTCGEQADPKVILEYIQKVLKPEEVIWKKLNRGVGRLE